MKHTSSEKITKAKSVSIRALVAIAGVVFGLLISAQMRSMPDRIINPISPYTSLKETRDSLYEEQGQLKENILNLQKSLNQAEKNTLEAKLSKTELANIKNKKALAGLTKLNGPGIIIELDDSKREQITEDSIVHAADLRDIVNLLWSSGAEAISINNQRVVANTAIDCIVNTILVNNTRLTTPFRIEAIGDQNKMYENIISLNNLIGLHERQKNNGLIFDASKNNDITVLVFDGSFDAKSETK